jgi:hypothetical protein
MYGGIDLAQHYAAEALRLSGAHNVADDLREAQQLLTWLLTMWTEPIIALVQIYQRGPHSIRNVKRARRAVAVLEDHGWLVQEPSGTKMDDRYYREVWRIRRMT